MTKSVSQTVVLAVLLNLPHAFAATGQAGGTAREEGSGRIMFGHPVLAHRINKRDRSRLEQHVASLMELGDEELVALVLTQTPLVKHGCPLCRKGKPYDKDWDDQCARMLDYRWDHRNPGQIQCKTFGTVFPSEQFPMDCKEAFHSPAGRVVKIPYYLDPGQSGGHLTQFSRSRASRSLPVAATTHTHRREGLNPDFRQISGDALLIGAPRTGRMRMDTAGNVASCRCLNSYDVP